MTHRQQHRLISAATSAAVLATAMGLAAYACAARQITSAFMHAA